MRLSETPEERIARLVKIGVLVSGCPRCESDIAEIRKTGVLPMGPAHQASPSCASGKRPHCTCDTCF
jgi:hypothetical protein